MPIPQLFGKAFQNENPVYAGAAFQEIVQHQTPHIASFPDEIFVRKDWRPDNLKKCQ